MEYKLYLSEAKDPQDWRGCLMATVPDDIANAIKTWGKKKISEDSLTNSGFENYIHCTVLYGFSQQIKFEQVKQFLQSSLQLTDKSDIVFTLGKVSRFECPEYDVLKIEVKDCMKLFQAHMSLKKKFHVKTSYATYNPHATIAYVKKGSHPEHDGADLFDGIEVQCKQLTYSTGPEETRTRDQLNYESFKQQLGRKTVISI